MLLELKDSEDNLVTVDEGESTNLVTTLEFDGVQFAKAGLLSLTLTLYDKDTEAVINSRNSQNILDANGSSVATDGTVTIELDAADNAVVDEDKTAGQVESHIARVIWTWNDGNGVRTGKSEMMFNVVKLAEPA